MTDVRAAANRLREAVCRGSYNEARRILAEYRAQLEEAVNNLPADDPQVVEVVLEAKRCLELALRVAVAARAHAGARLAQMSATAPYRRLVQREPCIWQLEG